MANAQINDLSSSFRKQLNFDATLTSIISKTENCNQVFIISDKTKKASFYSKPQKIELKDADPFISFSARWQEKDDDFTNSIISVRFSKDSILWDNWMVLTKDEHNENNAFATSKQFFLDKNYIYYQIKVTSNQSKKGYFLNNIFLNFFSPSNQSPNTTIITNNETIGVDNASCPCPLPTYINRVAWGNPQGANQSSFTTTTVTHLIVHHSAGSNTSSNWAAVVKSIYDFHVGTQGYADIGYNWLIAPDGTLFEGRQADPTTRNIVGAHFCGMNGNTMGVCMIGTYTTATITAEARNTLVRLLAWKCCGSNINPTATANHAAGLIRTISGHRDGCSTECPGNTTYDALPTIRTDVNSYMNNGCTVTALPRIEGLKDVTVSPNPSVNGVFQLKIQLTTTKKMQYSILSADGKILQTSAKERIAGLFQKNISVQKNAAGLYYLKLMLDNEQVVKLLIVGAK